MYNIKMLTFMVIGLWTEKAVVMSFLRTANEKHIPLGTKGAK